MPKLADCKSIKQFIFLDGDWDFTYRPEFPGKKPPAIEDSQMLDDPSPFPAYMSGDKPPTLPKSEDFEAKMPVPGYWDDHLENLKDTAFWSKAIFNPKYRKGEFPLGDNPPDATLAWLLGVGWYRKILDVPADWKSRLVTLYVGGVVLEAWVWLNGRFLGYHLGHSTPFEMPLDKFLIPGKKNELIIAVANTRRDRTGCIIRGYKGFSAGIYRGVHLKVSGSARIKDCYIRPSDNLRKLHWQVELEGKLGKAEAVLQWKIKDPRTGALLGDGKEPGTQRRLRWQTGTFGMRRWSDNDPNLYEVELGLLKKNVVQDSLRQSFGLRRLKRDRRRLRLNGRPVWLRGNCEHAYFPLTCTPPPDVETYRENIRKLKEIGFNWLRFHTWVPSEEYMQAADELGMMIQVEPPVGFGEQEWLDILFTCRRHPSVVIYCCGNEEWLSDRKIKHLRKLAALQKKHVPDGLFAPMEGMRGVEYFWKEQELDPGRVDEPYPHNPRRLELLKEFTDVWDTYNWGHLSYNTASGDWRVVDERLERYERPCLSHENGIIGTYMDLGLEYRYKHTRIGTDLYESARKNLRRAGLLEKAPLYYKNSCAWMRILSKHNMEMARKCRLLSGYDRLGAIDNNWHRSIYTCGLMNEFYELKPGISAADVLKSNGESILLLDHTNYRNLTSGDRIELELLSSLYGAGPLEKGMLFWYLADEKRNILHRKRKVVENVKNGAVEKLETIRFKAPGLIEPSKITLFVRLSGGEYEITNDWDFWVFPPRRAIRVTAAADEGVMKRLRSRYKNLLSLKKGASRNLRIVSALDGETLRFLNEGGKVLLLGSAPFETLATSFQPACAGRTHGNLATVIYDHPLMNDFPHEHFCDWQFYSMLEGSSAVVFNDLNVEFDPIVEIVSSFKLIKKQAAVFELRVGRGALLVCSLNLQMNDPAAVFLLDSMLGYVSSERFCPRIRISARQIENLRGGRAPATDVLSTDMGFDEQAHL